MEAITPRFENGRSLLIAGTSERYNFHDVAGIPGQWRRFGPQMGSIPGQVDHKGYGVCSRFDGEGNFDYICGVEVESFGALPQEWARIRLGPQRYAVFSQFAEEMRSDQFHRHGLSRSYRI